MAYIVVTEKTKNSEYPRGESFYCTAFGCFALRKNATRFESFEAAQPTVRKLREQSPDWFFAAIEVAK